MGFVSGKPPISVSTATTSIGCTGASVTKSPLRYFERFAPIRKFIREKTADTCPKKEQRGFLLPAVQFVQRRFRHHSLSPSLHGCLAKSPAGRPGGGRLESMFPRCFCTFPRRTLPFASTNRAPPLSAVVAVSYSTGAFKKNNDTSSAPSANGRARVSKRASGDGREALGEIHGIPPMFDRVETPVGITADIIQYDDRQQARRCVGCGCVFQHDDLNAPGYVEQRIAESFSGGRRKVYPKMKGVPVEAVPDGVPVMMRDSPKDKARTKLLICRRCYRLQHYHKIDAAEARSKADELKAPFLSSETHEQGTSAVMREASPLQHENGVPVQQDSRSGEVKPVASCVKSQDASHVIQLLCSRLERDSVVLKTVDVLDIESSVVPELFETCRSKRLKVIWLVNKIDCLPKGSKVDDVKLWVRRMVRQIKNAHIDDVVMVSAATGAGFSELEDRLRKYMDINNPKCLYVVGRVNSGKSTFVNRFLDYIGYRHLGALYHRRAVGGVTRAAVPGTTQNFLPFALPKGFKLIDTPGVPTDCQITAFLPSADDLYSIVPRKRLQPITYALKEGGSLIIGAMARIDQVSPTAGGTRSRSSDVCGGASLCTCYFSHHTTLHICRTVHAVDLLRRKACTFLYPPHRPDDFSSLQPFVRHRVKVYGGRYEALDDIVISGLGWIAITGYGPRELDVWVPKGVKVFRRPAMLPKGIRRTGVDKFHKLSPRARGARINMRKKRMCEELRNAEIRRKYRAQLEETEQRRIQAKGDAHPESGGVTDSTTQFVVSSDSVEASHTTSSTICDTQGTERHLVEVPRNLPHVASRAERLRTSPVDCQGNSNDSCGFVEDFVTAGDSHLLSSSIASPR